MAAQRGRVTGKSKINGLWWAANLAAAAPLALMVWDYSQGVLGIDPVNAINNRSGRTAIILLFASLACTPLNILFGWRQVVGLRKSLGLWAVAYAVIHLLNFVGLDYAFNFGQIMQDAVLDKPYILAGLAALLALIPLAVTSTRGWMRRLGKNWKRLHRLAYAAGVLAALHFFWQAKAAERWEPLIYAVVLSALLAVRIPPLRRALASGRTGAARALPQGQARANAEVGLTSASRRQPNRESEAVRVKP